LTEPEASSSKLYVQFGCGFDSPEGWENFDAPPTLQFERMPIIGGLYTKNHRRFPKNVHYGNIVRGLPIKTDTVDGQYTSHVLEHLTLKECRAALRNSFKIMKSGGIFRLVVLDLRVRAELYLSSSASHAAIEFMEATLGLTGRPQNVVAKMISCLETAGIPGCGTRRP